ncbi:MAG: SlyX family protein [Hydrogenovibrio sp.]|uniref:SlyX family protein n=1 Tax=Hydrogenovibrio TaxID=28884 RepID=UPI0003A57589|nr:MULTISPECIES: SlyX family protein [Hydrogenovibrio]MDR9497715.1 SlyX family protein [Hydrogenovibrio sp.]
MANEITQLSDGQQRLEQLEMTCAYQQDTIDTLNRTVGQQHQQLQLLQKQINILSDAFKALRSEQSGIKPVSEETPPPHY